MRGRVIVEGGELVGQPGSQKGRRMFGISIGGIIIIVGIILMFVLDAFWIGLIVALVGLLAFGGFAKGKWY
ncbi:MAG: hypothetical protein ACRDMY_01550 [Gaiellaceae bacterium]